MFWVCLCWALIWNGSTDSSENVMSHSGRLLLIRQWRLTAVNTKMLLQVMFVFEGFSTLAAFELAVSSSFVEQRRLQTQKQTVRMWWGWVGVAEHRGKTITTRLWNTRSWRGSLIVFSEADLIVTETLLLFSSAAFWETLWADFVQR